MTTWDYDVVAITKTCINQREEISQDTNCTGQMGQGRKGVAAFIQEKIAVLDREGIS